MEKRIVTNNSAGSESIQRNILDKYYSVQFSPNGKGPVYLFKLRDISLKGLCILVKENSAILKGLKVGDILNMEYNSLESSGFTEIFKTKIRYISKTYQGRFTEDYLVGLSIIDK